MVEGSMVSIFKPSVNYEKEKQSIYRWVSELVRGSDDGNGIKTGNGNESDKLYWKIYKKQRTEGNGVSLGRFRLV